jgi:hypothetical protein
MTHTPASAPFGPVTVPLMSFAAARGAWTDAAVTTAATAAMATSDATLECDMCIELERGMN